MRKNMWGPASTEIMRTPSLCHVTADFAWHSAAPFGSRTISSPMPCDLWIQRLPLCLPKGTDFCFLCHPSIRFHHPVTRFLLVFVSSESQPRTNRYAWNMKQFACYFAPHGSRHDTEPPWDGVARARPTSEQICVIIPTYINLQCHCFLRRPQARANSHITLKFA